MPREFQPCRLDPADPAGSIRVLQSFLDRNRDVWSDATVVVPPAPAPAEPSEGQLHFNGTTLGIYSRGVRMVLPMAEPTTPDSIPSWIRAEWAARAEELTLMGVPETEWGFYA